MKSNFKSPVRAVTVIGLLLLLGLAIWSLAIEPNQLVIHEEVISLPHWPNGMELKVAAIADIHAGSPFINENKLRQIVSRTNECNPDLVVLLGDFMVQTKLLNTEMDPELIAAPLKDLHPRLGTYAVLGNHDWWYNGVRVRQALENVGIRVLENEVAEIKVDQHSLWLVGLADVWTRPQNILGTLSRVRAGGPILALTHNPDIFPQVPASVDLTLAGHTHGGQVTLPILGRLVVPSQYGQRYAAGQIEESGRHLFVTTGIGTSIFPVRFRVPPEIALLTLRAQ